MLRKMLPIALLAALILPAAQADELTQIIQADLTELGYDTGGTDGEMNTQTIVAISKFQAENNLDVTGEASPQLAGVIKSKIKQRDNPAPAASGQPAVAPGQDTAALHAAQQACLQQKIDAAQAKQKKKRGLGRLARAASRTAARFGSGTAGDIARVSNDVYAANATADDLQAAAQDLGITESDLEECRNPTT